MGHTASFYMYIYNPKSRYASTFQAISKVHVHIFKGVMIEYSPLH